MIKLAFYGKGGIGKSTAVTLRLTPPYFSMGESGYPPFLTLCEKAKALTLKIW